MLLILPVLSVSNVTASGSSVEGGIKHALLSGSRSVTCSYSMTPLLLLNLQCNYHYTLVAVVIAVVVVRFIIRIQE